MCISSCYYIPLHALHWVSGPLAWQAGDLQHNMVFSAVWYVVYFVGATHQQYCLRGMQGVQQQIHLDTFTDVLDEVSHVGGVLGFN